MSEEKFTLEEAHTQFAKKLNGETWNLLGKEARTPEEDDRMVQTAHASLYHWLHAGTGLHQQRGHWMLAHVYTILKRVEPAVHHAEACLALTEKHADLMKDFDIAYGFEGIARAYALAGKTKKAREYKQKARRAGDKIADAEDKKIFDGDYEGGDWFGLG